MALMIPGAWEARRVTAATPPLPPAAAITPAAQPARALNHSHASEPPSREAAAWIKVSVFAAALLAGMWLAMAAIHPLPI